MHGIDYDMHLLPIRLGARFVDPDAFLISSAVMKTHNMVVATMSIKNVVLGAPLPPPPGQNRPWNESEKRKFHVGIRAGNYNMYLAVQRMMHNWGVGIVDGYEGMEGNGPVSGTPVPHRIALASTDFLAVDRVGLECMGIDASWPGYLNYAYQAGLGQYDLSKIDVLGARIADVQRKYRLHADVDRMLEWRGPMMDLPPNLGRNRRLQGRGPLHLRLIYRGRRPRDRPASPFSFARRHVDAAEVSKHLPSSCCVSSIILLTTCSRKRGLALSGTCARNGTRLGWSIQRIIASASAKYRSAFSPRTRPSARPLASTKAAYSSTGGHVPGPVQPGEIALRIPPLPWLPERRRRSASSCPPPRS